MVGFYIVHKRTMIDAMWIKIINSRLILTTLTQTAVAPNVVMSDICDTG